MTKQSSGPVAWTLCVPGKEWISELIASTDKKLVPIPGGLHAPHFNRLDVVLPHFRDFLLRQVGLKSGMCLNLRGIAKVLHDPKHLIPINNGSTAYNNNFGGTRTLEGKRSFGTPRFLVFLHDRNMLDSFLPSKWQYLGSFGRIPIFCSSTAVLR